MVIFLKQYLENGKYFHKDYYIKFPLQNTLALSYQ